MLNGDSVLRWPFFVKNTKDFSCIDVLSNITPMPTKKAVVVNINSEYTSQIILAAIDRRKDWCSLVVDNSQEQQGKIYQFSEFELIDWEHVVNGQQSAAAYVVRKGLSRKAQLALQTKKYIAKHPHCLLKSAIPFTVIVETWDAYEDDVKMDFGMGAIATFSTPGLMYQTKISQKLEWCLDHVREIMQDPCRSDWLWILKPSVTNKGADISVITSWDMLIDRLEDTPDIREWVLQEYIQRPLTIDGYKFHIRVYVLCVGALQVYVYQDMLLLLAAHKYDLEALEDDYVHLTNTCRGAEDIDFDENVFVRVIDDLPTILREQYPNQFSNIDEALRKTREMKKAIGNITSEIFEAYENEYTIFSPMPNCFEVFGLDFMVDDLFQISLLEINPGPDFKQTGLQLRRLIVNLWEGICSKILDKDALEENCSSYKRNSDTSEPLAMVRFKKVYDKELSVSKVKQNMKFS